MSKKNTKKTTKKVTTITKEERLERKKAYEYYLKEIMEHEQKD